MDDITPSFDLNVNIDVQEVLLAASNHDICRLRHLVRSDKTIENPANVRDPETGATPLHAAIAACELDDDVKEEAATSNGNHSQVTQPETQSNVTESALGTVKFLLGEGAIWNDLDRNNETPGCIARRLGLQELYEVMVDAGVRAELLLNRLDGYEPLLEEEEEEQREQQQQKQEEDRRTEEQEREESQRQTESVAEATTATTGATDPSATNKQYLSSSLSIGPDRILDAAQNGVMMAWERDIMNKSALKLLPREGLRVLNVGHGMGIVDGFLQKCSPSEHHIVEAHPDVLCEMRRKGWDTKPGVHLHEGRWQDVLPVLIDQGMQFDAIYYDTFAEGYTDFRDFFTEHVIALLDQDGRWGFFNGMGADRQISYDVYQKVVEVDLFEAGFDVEWEEIPVPTLEGEWEGIRRPYWVIESYRLPLCKYMD